MINRQRKPAYGMQKLQMCGKSRTEILIFSSFNQFVFGQFIDSPKEENVSYLYDSFQTKVLHNRMIPLINVLLS